jgi:hypothetical protein
MLLPAPVEKTFWVPPPPSVVVIESVACGRTARGGAAEVGLPWARVGTIVTIKTATTATAIATDRLRCIAGKTAAPCI